ncbi:hypothetical protein D3C81_1376660 [compost metagenome]
MYRVDRVHLAGVDPGLEHRGTALEPGAVVFAEIVAQALAAADDLHGEDPRCLRVAPGKLHLGADVAAQGLGWVIVDSQGVESAVPQLDDVAQHCHIQAELVGEVIVQVGLGQPGLEGDGVHAGALETVAGELVLGGLDDGLLVLLANAAGGLARGLGAMRRDFKGHERFQTRQWVSLMTG